MISTNVYIDGHCHLHDQVDPANFLESARNNIRRHSKKNIPYGKMEAVLCLADFSGANGFSRLLCDNGCLGRDGWKLSYTDEDNSIRLVNIDGDRIWIIAGHQTVTNENIEVNSIGSISKPISNQPIMTTISIILNSGALPVLPWGFGKWWGKRGKKVRLAMDEYGQKIALGDNGGRPMSFNPVALKTARKRDISVIPGSDPLPIDQDHLRNGAFGFILSGPIIESKPARWLLINLKNITAYPEFFGTPLRTIDFIKHQFSLRLKVSR